MNTEQRIQFNNIPVPDDIKKLVETFKQNDHGLYIVGGAVRDAYMGDTPKDYDLVTDAKPKEVISFLEGVSFVDQILTVGESFAVVNVITVRGNEYEIATFREESYNKDDRRRPDKIEYSDMYGDVRRRDLTINALYYDIKDQEIIDLVGGVHNINNGVIRTVGDAEDRFEEDRLRKLRAIRFAVRYNAGLDHDITNTLINNNTLEGVSNERIREEFLKGLNKTRSVKDFMAYLFFFGFHIPIFGGLWVNPFDVPEDDDPIVLMGTLLKHNYPTTVSLTLNELKYSRKEVRDIVFLVYFSAMKDHNDAFLLKKKHNRSYVDSKQLNKFGIYNNMDRSLVRAFMDYELSITGEEVMEQYNIDGGPEVGRLIEELETERFKELL